MEIMTTNLSNIIDSSGRLDEYDASQVLKSIGEALSYCHFKQLIHRDVKPDIILISGDSVKLEDFGVSTFEQGRTICGTEGYMTPEIITDQMYSYQVDSYALGVIVHQILTTTMPFNDEKDGGKSKKWKFETNESFNEDIMEVLSELLEAKPRRRWTMKQVLESTWIKKEEEKLITIQSYGAA